MRLLIVSDLHLSEDNDLSIFAGEKALPRLLETFSDAPTHLILNGDALDFLQNGDPLTLDVKRSAQRAGDILAAPTNQATVRALRGLLAAGGKVTFRCGNHDLELALREVQDRIRQELDGSGLRQAQIEFETGARPRRIDVGKVSLLVTHGDEDDRFNRVRYGALDAAVRGEASFTYPPGSLLVKSLLNPLKTDYRMRFADLLKPDFQGAVLTALAVNPGALRLLLQGDTARILRGLLTNHRTLAAPLTVAAPVGEREEVEAYQVLLDRLRAAGVDPEGLMSGEAVQSVGLGVFTARLRAGLAREGLRLYAGVQRALTGGQGARYFSTRPGEREWEGAVKLAREHDVSAVIQGHTHAARWRSDETLTFVNTGTWIWLMRTPSPEASDGEWLAWLDELRRNPALEGETRLARLETHLTALRIDPTAGGALLGLLHCAPDGTITPGPSALLPPRAAVATPLAMAVVASPSAPVIPAPATLESIFLRVKERPDASPDSTAWAAVRDLAPAWQLRSFWDSPFDFELLPPDPLRPPAPDTAWRLVHVLRQQPWVADASPMFETRLEVPDEASAGRPSLLSPLSAVLGVLAKDDPATAGNHEWSLERIEAAGAWGVAGGKAVKGEGILIAHPDTGYTEHTEISGSLLIPLGWDFLGRRADARDDLSRDAVLPFPGHGTSTASVIASDEGPGSKPHVTGVAPLAKLVPMRVARTVVLLSMGALTRAIRGAINRGCHVISISLGGLWNRQLHEVIQEAVEAGIIVLAATGNYVGFVAWPAAYDEVIAVSASDYNDVPWPGTSRGPAVDISAPGASVWCARVDEEEAPPRSGVTRGSGTSFAVATVAGVAALWLAHHGRQTLLARYGGAGMVRVFKQLLQATSRRTASWDRSRYGAGIVNARALLERKLPAAAPDAFARKDTSLWSTLLALTPLASPAALGAAALPVSDESLEEELRFHLATDPLLRPRAQLPGSDPVAAAPATHALRSVEMAPSMARLARLRDVASPALAARLGSTSVPPSAGHTASLPPLRAATRASKGEASSSPGGRTKKTTGQSSKRR